MTLQIIKYKNLWYIISGAMFIGAIIAIAVLGLNFGIDFTGGSLLRIKFEGSLPQNAQINEALKEFNLGAIVSQPTESNSIILKFKSVDEPTHQNILNKIQIVFKDLKPQEEKFDSIGPVIGNELKRKAFWSVVLSLIMIVIYVAIAFRKVSRPVNSMKYSIATLIALFHDVIIMIGIFAVFSYYTKAEIGLSFIAAILTVLGYSVNDTIVVFDRTRENLKRFFYGGGFKDTFENLVNNALNQTLARSINTTLTTLIPLIVIYFIGGESIKYFAFALITGITLGAYSSIFIASPLLISFYKLSINK